MRVGIDVAPLLQTQAGTARWVKGLLGALERRDDVVPVRLTWGGPGRLTAVARDVLWYHMLLPRSAARTRLDVLHCTIYRGPLRSRVPAIVTVHDLAVLRHPEVFPLWTRLHGRVTLGPTLRAARRVIAVSEFSKRETAELVGIDPDRIDVVPNAVDPVFTAFGRAVQGDYALAVGTLEPRKNLPVLLQAFSKLRRDFPVRLAIAGARGWLSDDIFTTVSRLAIADGVHFIGEIPPADLRPLYCAAELLVLPSLYEGFGLPPLEAMACGTPVVVSDAGSLPEIVGAAGVIVRAEDPDDIAQGLGWVLGNAEFRSTLSRRGLERAATFSWARAARETMAVYERVMAA